MSILSFEGPNTLCLTVIDQYNNLINYLKKELCDF